VPLAECSWCTGFDGPDAPAPAECQCARCRLSLCIYCLDDHDCQVEPERTDTAEVEQFEQTLGRLYDWGVQAREWQSTRKCLADKLLAYRLQKAFQDARRILRVQLFTFEAMVEDMVNKTPARKARR